MKTIQIFDPAMCCDTGLCGPSLDPELFRVSTVINTLKKQDINVQRFNLSQEPQEFVNNPVISELMNKEGVEILPITLLDGEVVKTKSHPSNQEFCNWLELPEHSLDGIMRLKPKSCSK